MNISLHDWTIGDGTIGDRPRLFYVLYLVRQGARLAELADVVGPVSSAQLASYAPYSPPGPKRPLSDIELVYPALRGV